jgi:competence protein ComEC
MILLISAVLGVSAAVHAAAVSSGPVASLAARSTYVDSMLTVAGDPRRIAAAPDRHRPALAVLPVRITEIVTGDGTAYRVGVSATVLARLTPSSSPPPTATTASWLGLLPSEHVAVRGKLVPPKPGTQDGATILADRPPVLVSGPSTMQATAGALRADLRDATSGLPADPAGVLPALAVGDTGREPPDVAEAFKRTGLTYLTVASGENLMFLTGALLPAARRLGMRGRALTGLGFLIILGFTVLARPGPPMVRATVMSLIGSAAALFGRRCRALPVMAAAALVLLLFNPWLARAYGFALSVAATAGLLIAAPGWFARLLDRGVPGWMAGPAAVTAACEVFCEPLLVTFTGSLPLLAVPANILAAPAAPPATVLGVLAMAGYALWPPLGRLFAWVGQWPVRWICLVARVSAGIPGAAIGWPRGPAGCLILLGAYVIFAVLWSRWAQRARSRRQLAQRRKGTNRLQRSQVV